MQEEAVALVFAREGRLDAVFVLEEALVEFAGDASVEGAGGAAENVDVAFWHRWLLEIRNVWPKDSNGGVGNEFFGILRFAQDDGKNQQRQKPTTARTTAARTNNGKNKAKLVRSGRGRSSP